MDTMEQHDLTEEIPHLQDDSPLSDLSEEEDDDEFPIPAPPLPAPVFAFQNGISAFCFSLTGRSHLERDLPCQDRCGLRFLPSGILIAGVADGVGQCFLSDHGADTAVHAALDFLESRLEPLPSRMALDAEPMTVLLREAMEHALSAVERRAAELEQLPYSFQSTLSIAVYDGSNLFFAHAGDDGIIALRQDGTCTLVTTRHKGKEVSSVYPLQSRSTWEFGQIEDVAAFAMVTDGVLDAFVGGADEGSPVYDSFLEPAFSASPKSLEETGAICRNWVEYMTSPAYQRVVRDDITFLCVVNPSAKSAPFPAVFEHSSLEDTP